MGYVRKTEDVWCIETNYGYGWETESIYSKKDYESPYMSARVDAHEYALLGCDVRIVKRRERIR